VVLLQVVSAACKALATLARRSESAASILTANAQNYFAALQHGQDSSSASAYCSRSGLVSMEGNMPDGFIVIMSSSLCYVNGQGCCPADDC
jgi:hypothetical protein